MPFSHYSQILDNITKRPTKTPVTFDDVYKEFNETITSAIGITTFLSRKVTKHFAFTVPGVHVPATCEYMEVFTRNKIFRHKQIKNNQLRCLGSIRWIQTGTQYENEIQQRCAYIWSYHQFPRNVPNGPQNQGTMLA